MAKRRPGARELAETCLRQMCLDCPEAHAFELLDQTPDDREKVVEFIAEVCDDFSLKPQTAGLAVTYYDRFMRQKNRPRCGDELAGIVCIMIASKFVETKVPAMSELRTITPIEFTRDQIKEAEIKILGVLGWQLHTATPHSFLEQLAIIVELAAPFRKRAEFLVDMSYYEHKILEFSPFVVAVAALTCSWAQLGDQESESRYTRKVSELCGVQQDDLERCKEILIEHFDVVFGVGFTTGPPTVRTDGSSPIDVMTPDLGGRSTPGADIATLPCQQAPPFHFSPLVPNP